jgi:actin-related protein 8
MHTDRYSPNSDFLKRDDQILALRLQADERLDRRKRAAVDIDRARAHGAAEGVPYGEPDPDQDVDDDEPMDDIDSEDYGSKTIILHPGSQNLRLGLATDALPKTVPMVIARKSDHTESEVSEPRPKRLKTDGPSEEWFGEDFANQYNAMAQEFKSSRRASKRRVLPNSRELVTKWNSTTSPEIISEHNDPLRIDWTELPADASEAPEYFVGAAALRIPEKSNPRYKLSWPLRNGWLNERDYQSRNVLERDYFLIIEESIKEQLGLNNKKEWSQYNCVFIIPDLYEKVLIAQILRQLIVDFGFQRVCFIQESLAATFGAGFGIACIIDMGAEKTSVACVEDGMVIEDSRMNLKFGGHDMTETFTKMMLFDRFNYSDFNLMRRHDFLLAEELKEKYTTMSDEAISVQTLEFHLRAHGQQTRKYTFKIYDEGMLAPMVSGIENLICPVCLLTLLSGLLQTSALRPQ